MFDLHLLRPRLARLPVLTPAVREELSKAVERTMGLSHDDYLTQVVAYLDPEQAAMWRDRGVWDSMQLETVELLEELGR